MKEFGSCTQDSVQPTLLIVDDDVSNLASLVKVFDKLAVRVIAATSGEEAIKSVRDTPIDIILTDLMMPGMDGIELLKNVKAIAPDTEVIMMTPTRPLSAPSKQCGKVRTILSPNHSDGYKSNVSSSADSKNNIS